MRLALQRFRDHRTLTAGPDHRADLTRVSPAALLRTAVPGEALLHPLSLGALAALLLNDHWLKDRWGTRPYANVLTGKASDLAGLVFFPLLLLSLVELARWTLRGRRAPGIQWTFTRSELTAALAITGLGFASVQALPPAADAYAQALAAIRWLPTGLLTAATANPLPPLPRIHHVMDASDLLCLPALWLSYWTASGVRPP